MIVAVPTDENNASVNVCVSFGRAPYFLFYNTENGETVFAENPAAVASGGAGVKAAQFIVDRGAKALITVRAGENAAEVLTDAKMDIWKAINGTVNENLSAYHQGKLSRLDHFHAGFHGKA